MKLALLSRCIFYPTLLVVTALAVMPADDVVISTGWDKANHVIAFVVLLALLDQAYPRAKLWFKKLLPLLLYGVLIELIQSMIPGRFASVMDIVADIIGLGLYCLVRPLLYKILSELNLHQLAESAD